jgi:hypothetical protein
MTEVRIFADQELANLKIKPNLQILRNHEHFRNASEKSLH